MTRNSTRYIRTVCESVSRMVRNHPTMENAERAVDLLAKLESAYAYDMTRTGAKRIDDTITEIERIVYERARSDAQGMERVVRLERRRDI